MLKAVYKSALTPLAGHCLIKWYWSHGSFTRSRPPPLYVRGSDDVLYLFGTSTKGRDAATGCGSGHIICASRHKCPSCPRERSQRLSEISLALCGPFSLWQAIASKTPYGAGISLATGVNFTWRRSLQGSMHFYRSSCTYASPQGPELVVLSHTHCAVVTIIQC